MKVPGRLLKTLMLISLLASTAEAQANWVFAPEKLRVQNLPEGSVVRLKQAIAIDPGEVEGSNAYTISTSATVEPTMAWGTSRRRTNTRYLKCQWKVTAGHVLGKTFPEHAGLTLAVNASEVTQMQLGFQSTDPPATLQGRCQVFVRTEVSRHSSSSQIDVLENSFEEVKVPFVSDLSPLFWIWVRDSDQ